MQSFIREVETALLFMDVYFEILAGMHESQSLRCFRREGKRSLAVNGWVRFRVRALLVSMYPSYTGKMGKSRVIGSMRKVSAF
jgi:hypothetical protein